MIEYITIPLNHGRGVDWALWIALSTSIATWIYTLFVVLTLRNLSGQVEELRRSREIQSTGIVFKELQSTKARRARQYIYEHVPKELVDTFILETELKTHLQKAGEALVAFDRVGFLAKEGDINPAPIIEHLWPVIWRCWKKSEALIRWARDKRGESEYLSGFGHLFDLSEAYRESNMLPEPKFF